MKLTRTLARPLTLLALAAAGVGGLAACGTADHATDTTSASSTPGSTTPTPGAFPSFAPTDYTFTLTVGCYCPVVGKVDITVKGGAVASATLASGPDKGKDAPAYTHKTINDIIAIANDPANKAKVVWPSGQDAPSRVTVNPLKRATDASITYAISNLSAG